MIRRRMNRRPMTDNCRMISDDDDDEEGEKY